MTTETKRPVIEISSTETISVRSILERRYGITNPIQQKEIIDGVFPKLRIKRKYNSKFKQKTFKQTDHE